MTQNSFEVFTLKKGQWQIDCVFDDRMDATDEAARMVNVGHFDGIKVVQEDYDERLNQAKIVVVTEWIKGQDSRNPSRRHQTLRKGDGIQGRHKTVASSEQKKKRSFLHQAVVSIILICLVLLGIMLAGFFLVDRFGS